MWEDWRAFSALHLSQTPQILCLARFLSVGGTNRARRRRTRLRRLAARFLEQACGTTSSSNYFSQRYDFHSVGEGVATFTGIHNDKPIQVEVVQSNSHPGCQGGRVLALVFNPQAPAVLEQQ